MFSINCSSDLILGHFATIVLQVPVEGGHEGGLLTIQHHQNTQVFDHSSDSHRNFYMSVVHADSELEMTPVSKGYRIELIFHIKWNSPAVVFYPPLPDISSFLVALTKIRKDFQCWAEQRDQEGAPKMLVIGLEHKYDAKYHSFGMLKGQDRSVAHLMRSHGLLEVYLALLTRKVTGSTQPTDFKLESSSSDVRSRPSKKINQIQRIAYTVSHWMGVDNLAAQFQGLEMESQTQFVGSVFKAGSKPDREEIINHPDSNSLTITRWYNQSVLILWPKSKSFYFDVCHRFDLVLERMEREPLTESSVMLTKVLSLSPEWIKTGPRIFRMLNLCLRFKASQEAIQLMEIMVNETIGIPSDDDARLIAELESQLLGWASCEELISKLMACKPAEQMDHFAALSQALHDRGSFTGFDVVSQKTLELFFAHVKLSPLLNRSTLAACVDMLIRIEENSESSNLAKLNEFLSYAVQWKMLQQCHLIIDIEHISRRSHVGVNCLLYLSFHVVHNFDPNDESLEDCIVDLVNCFAWLPPHDPNALHFFVERLCQPADHSNSNTHLLKKLVSSIQFLNLPSDLLQELVDARISELKSHQPPKFTWEQKEAQFLGAEEFPEVLAFLQSPEKEMVVKSAFTQIQEARNFADTFFGVMDNCVKLGHSAIAKPLGSGKTTRCLIVKSRHLFLAQSAKFKEDCKELDYLLKQRVVLGFLPLDVPTITQDSFSEFASTLKRIEEEEALECSIDNDNLPAAKKVKAIGKRASSRKK